jgi:outer membrane protein assembly factor BamA
VRKTHSLSSFFKFIVLLGCFILPFSSYGFFVDSKIVGSIVIVGNKTTNQRIIKRELTFTTGDTLTWEQAEMQANKSKKNLDNTLLFNFVTITFDTIENQLVWLIVVEERWYIWPIPILEYADRNLSSFLNNGDYSRINAGLFVRVDNFRGMKEQLKLRLVGGYRNQIGINYSSIHLDKRKKHGLSAWSYFATNKEIAFQTTNNKPSYFKTEDKTARKVFLAEINYTYRPMHNWYHKLSTSIQMASISDTIAQLNPNYFGNGQASFSSFQVRGEVIYDSRNFKIFPLSGTFFGLEFGRYGLFSFDDLSHWGIKTSLRHYRPLLKRVYGSFDILIKKNFTTNLPYFQSEATGYKNYIRGFEYNVTNGSGYMINKNSILLELLPTKIIKLPLVPDGKFKKAHLAIYWSVYADTGYTTNDLLVSGSNGLEGKLLSSLGTGLYFVAYYDLVFRIEYSYNSLHKGGLFVHFGTPFLND